MTPRQRNQKRRLFRRRLKTDQARETQLNRRELRAWRRSRPNYAKFFRRLAYSPNLFSDLKAARELADRILVQFTREVGVPWEILSAPTPSSTHLETKCRLQQYRNRADALSVARS